MLSRIGMTAALLVMSGLAARAAGDGFTPLVKGDDPKQFELVGFGPDTIQIESNGEVRVTGKPNGYFATKTSYKNYVLEFDWMYERPDGLENDAKFKGNSGVLLHIQAHKVWPQSVEVQLANNDAGHIFAIGGSKFKGRKDAEAQKRAIKPVGQWNKEVITCKDGAITCSINGIEVDTGTGATPDGGPIGWQSEGAPIKFRNLRIKPQD